MHKQGRARQVHTAAVPVRAPVVSAAGATDRAFGCLKSGRWFPSGYHIFPTQTLITPFCHTLTTLAGFKVEVANDVRGRCIDGVHSNSGVETGRSGVRVYLKNPRTRVRFLHWGWLAGWHVAVP